MDGIVGQSVDEIFSGHGESAEEGSAHPSSRNHDRSPNKDLMDALLIQYLQSLADSTGVSSIGRPTDEASSSPHLSSEVIAKSSQRPSEAEAGDANNLTDSLNLSSKANAVSKYRVRYDWKIMYEALLEFGREHGHYNVPRRYVCNLPEGTRSLDETHASIDKAPLGCWLTTQRADRLNNKLKEDRLAMLQALVDQGKLDWSPPNSLKDSDTSWPYMFECLVDYCRSQKLKNGQTFIVSSIHERLKWIHPASKEEVGLGRWMHTQYKRRRENRLREDRLLMFQKLIDEKKFQWPKVRKSNMKNDTESKTYSHIGLAIMDPPGHGDQSNQYNYVPSNYHQVNPTSMNTQRQAYTQSLLVSSNSYHPELCPLPDVDVERYNSAYNSSFYTPSTYNLRNISTQQHIQYPYNASLNLQTFGNRTQQSQRQASAAQTFEITRSSSGPQPLTNASIYQYATTNHGNQNLDIMPQ